MAMGGATSVERKAILREILNPGEDDWVVD
jgi:hypothetical protein